jgi:molecular chaperone DnaK (HSP70)
MWGFAIALVIALAAVLAAMGFKGRVGVVGIDLGTTFSVIGVREAGTVTIVTDEKGDALVPSIVSYLEGGGTAVGSKALDHLKRRPRSTVFGAKRFIGRGLEELIASDGKELDGVPYEVSASSDGLGEAWLKLHVGGEDRIVSPQAVGTAVVGELLRMASVHLGHAQVNQAVIAVPAKFSPRQRAATVEAFQAAGLKVVRILEEPTAAALAYGLEKRSDVHHVLVYDIGGGTLDVSLLFISDGNIQVVASEGDELLGGGDFDACLGKFLRKSLVKRAKVSVVEGSEQGGSAARVVAACGHEEPVCADHTMPILAEQAKKLLSDETSTKVRCRSRKRALGDSCESWELAEVTITREDFQRECSDLFSRALSPIGRLLNFAGFGVSEVDEAVMVGGTSRIPLIRDQLQSFLGLASLNTHIDPDVTVAYGAASIAH